MDIKFEQMFDKKVLDRGYEYYGRGAVNHVVVSPNHIKASVYGSRTYQVDITLDDGKIQAMKCNCPYAADYSHCKHEAAVLYEVREGIYEDKTVEGQTPVASETKVITNIPKEELIAFLSTKMAEDDSFRLLFHTYFAKYYTVSVAEFMNEWYAIIDRYSDHHGFITYYQAFSFESAVSIFDDKLLHASKYHPNEVFEVVTKLYYELCNFPIDDSNGTTYNIAQEFQDILIKCFHAGDDSLKVEIQSWILEAIDSEELTNYSLNDDLDSLYRKTLTLSEQIQYILDHSKNSYQIKELLDLLEEANADEKTIYSYMEQFQHIATARNWLIEYHLKNGEFKTVIELLRASLRYQNNETDTIRLLHLYDEHGYRHEYDELMRSYLTGSNQHIVELYQEYKLKFSEQEWKELCPKIIKDISYTKNRMQCYAIEQMKEPLIKEIEQANESIYDIFQYETLLMPEFEVCLIQKYRKMAEKLYPHIGNDNYDRITEIIEHIMVMPNGKTVAIEMVTQLKREYKARRNLMKLLRTLPIFDLC